MVYPNPVINNLNIRISNASEGVYHVVVYNLNGNIANNTTVASSNGNVSVDLSALAKGVYAVSIDKDGLVAVRTIVKQ